MSGQGKTSFVKGAMILAVAGFISRFLGLFYRVILTRLIGTEGVALFQVAYPIYTFLLVISVSGIPVALAKLVSEKIALGQKNEAHRIFMIARNLSLGIGGLLTLLLLVFAKQLIPILSIDPRAYYSLLAIAPAIAIVSVMASYRGFFQGMQNMVPTALSQILEQIVRMITIIGLAYFLLPHGIELAAAGATFSAVTGSIIGLIVMLYIYYKKKKVFSLDYQNEDQIEGEKVLVIIKRIADYAIPVILAASVVQLNGLVILGLVPRQLQLIGFTVEEATTLYGELTGVALVLVQFPNVITVALQTSLIPSISEAVALKDVQAIQNRTSTALRYALFVGLPSSIGLFTLALPLCRVIFGVSSAAVPLYYLAWGVIFISLQQTSSGILQGLGKVNIPARNLMVGAGVNAMLSYTLTAIPQFGIKGAAIGTVAGFAVTALLNIASLQRSLDVPIKMRSLIWKPAISATLMGVVVWLSYHQLFNVLQGKIPGSDAFATFFSVALGAVVYFIALLFTRALQERDLVMLPGMKRFIGPLKRLHLLR